MIQIKKSLGNYGENSTYDRCKEIKFECENITIDETRGSTTIETGELLVTGNNLPLITHFNFRQGTHVITITC